MLILSYGYKQPENGDRGSVFFPALNFDIQRLNDHNHDGNNSSKLSGQAIVGLAAVIVAAGWLALGGQPGTFYQDVNMPVGTLFDDYTPSFRASGGSLDGTLLELECVKIAGAQYRVFITDNTQDLRVLYLV